ncbi:MAG: peptidylprolyl isomerase [Thaumarchaeota archaeon]|nr:peptidylprolyl isomerase [Nitrososphaerota archaeon]
MPPGQISLSYTIRTVTENNFVVSSDNLNYFVQVMTASKVGDFKQDSKSIMLTIDDNAPVLVLLPKAVISGPYEVQLNGNPIEFKQYYQNGTHSWIRIEPFESGSIKITGIVTLPTEPEPVCGAGAILKDGICVVEEQQRGGGCLIATATYGSELAPQVQQLRELRDNTLLQTNSGSAFMESFNQFYYFFSPTIADWERQNPMFKETVRLTITPLLASLSILNYVDIDSESEMLGFGISVILLNIGMYFVAPAMIIVKIRGKFSKSD